MKPPKVKRRHPWLEGKTGKNQKRLYVPGDAPLDTTRVQAPKIRRNHAWLDSKNGFHRSVVYVPGITPLNSRISNKNLKLPNGTLKSTLPRTLQRKSYNVKEWNDSMIIPVQYICPNILTISSNRTKDVGYKRPNCTKKDYNVLQNRWDELKLPNAVNYTRVFVPKFKDLDKDQDTKRSTDTFKLPNSSISNSRSIVNCKFIFCWKET